MCEKGWYEYKKATIYYPAPTEEEEARSLF